MTKHMYHVHLSLGTFLYYMTQDDRVSSLVRIIEQRVVTVYKPHSTDAQDLAFDPTYMYFSIHKKVGGHLHVYTINW